MLLHAIIPASRANGPGLRAAVFFQGCTLGCPKCFNPTTHAFQGIEVALENVAEALINAHREYCLQGITISGGEPMQQADSLLVLMQNLRGQAPELTFGMFSGYKEGELDKGRYAIWGRELEVQKKRSLWEAIRSHLDFAVLGRFNYVQPGSAPLRSSRNQILRLFSNRYTEADFGEQLVEVGIHEDGRAVVTGFPVLGIPF
jgi:anaerobic ribonucleoside-triphosphate reductase activating protein